MKKSLFRLLLITLICILKLSLAQSQIIYVKGKVTDAKSMEPLTGVTVSTEKYIGTFTDLNGNFQLPLTAGDYEIKFSYLGWGDTSIAIHVTGQLNPINISLHQHEQALSEVVVGANRYSRPLAEQIVSMSNIPQKELQQKNIQDAAQALDQVSGIIVVDGQAAIRGGSGYAYGSGSRVMIVVDDVPLLTSDRNDIKWNFIPIENIDRIEIVKGASSVQYGSSALNGIVSIHTAFPTKKEETNCSGYVTRYDGSIPSFKIVSGDKTPFATGAYFVHKRKIGKSDFVFDAYGQYYQSWLQGDFARRTREHFKYRFRPNDHLTFGVNATALIQHTSTFMFWSNDSSGAYHPLNGTTTLIDLKEFFTTVAPYLTYFSKSGIKHSVHLQYYHTNQISGKIWLPTTHLFSGDYFIQKDFSSWMVSGGLSGNIFFFHDDGLQGTHIGNFGAAFFQFEKNWKKIRLEAGGRYETFRLDTMTENSRPVGRFGINYSPDKKIFFRSSYGQGFRFPSPAERFVNYSLGDIHIYPNPTLLPEKGWSAEIGVRKKAGNEKLSGYTDWAVFLEGYHNMLEFTFGQWGKPTDPLIGLGFKSLNVNEARIAGTELEIGMKKNTGAVKWNADAGYSYSYPVDLNADSSLRNPKKFMLNVAKGFGKPDSAFISGLLRYRNRHILKFDSDFSWREFSIGTSGKYYSRMDNIDFYFNIFIPGVKNYRETHINGDWVFDFRFSFQSKSYGKVSILINNFLNTNYAIRIGKFDAPRGFTLQYSYNW